MLYTGYVFFFLKAYLLVLVVATEKSDVPGLTRGSRFIIGGDDRGFNVGRASLTASPHSLRLSISNSNKQKVLSMKLADSVLGEQLTETRGHDIHGEYLYLIWSQVGSMKISNFKRGTSDCYNVETDVPGYHCILMGNDYWYGGSEMRKQYWPINTVNVPMSPYISHDTLQAMFGSVTERYFLSSQGVSVWVDEDLPLFASINNNGDNNICLNYNNTAPYSYKSSSLKPFRIEICVDSGINQVHKNVAEAHFKKPTGIPNENLFRRPIWSTWAQYKVNINQSIVLEFLDMILQNNFSIGQLEIDDDWTPKYGDLRFNHVTFPDPSDMIRKIHSKNLPVALWVHPFLNSDSQGFSLASSKGYLVKDSSGTKPALTKWWNGENTGVIDFTNPSAVEWFLNELNELKKIGVDSFKFDAGETTYLPNTPYKLNKNTGNPDTYVTAYARAAARSDLQNRQEYRTGVQTQDLPLMVRMIDKYSTWDYDEGFKTLITSALTFGILGYPFVLPDYIGGNGYDGNIPDPELYIRWVQANALMPIMQFSYTPWFFKNNTVVKVTRDMIALHEQYADKIIALAKDSMITGDPIMRPMWWIAPNDTSALTCDSQFMLGNDVLVAPVLDKGVAEREIYLPAGVWTNELTGQIISGPITFNYTVTLHDLPRFTKLA